MTQPFSARDAVLARAAAEVTRITSDGTWTDRDDAVLDETFERAARAALSVPALVERSVFVRKIARRFVPRAMRPLLRVVGKRLDRLLRTLAGALASRTGGK